MVVSRKQQLISAPPISRSPSSQPVPTKRLAQTLTLPAVQADATPEQNNENNESSPAFASSKLIYAESAKKRNSKPWIDRLILLTLSAFTLYAFFTCRPNPLFPSHSLYASEPTLCRAFVTYRTHILEPYVIPPITHTLSYTRKFSQPCISEAKAKLAPYLRPVQKALNTLSPYVERMAQYTRTVWNHTLKPYYKSAILPRYRRYIHPHLAPIQTQVGKYFAHYVSNPVRTKTNFVLRKLHRIYIRYINPYVRLARPHVHRISDLSYELTARVADAYVRVHPLLVNAWIRIRPPITLTWKRYKSFVVYVLEVTGSLVTKAAKEVCVYRRQYVDPHVIRIWEKVDNPRAFEVTDTITPPSATVVIPLMDDLDADEYSTVEVVSESTSSLSSVTTMATHTTEIDMITSDIESETSTLPTTMTVNHVPAASDVEETIPEDVQAALSVALESSDHASTVVHELEKEIQSKIGLAAPPTMTTTVSSSTPSIQKTSSKLEVPIVNSTPSADNSDSVTETTMNVEPSSTSETVDRKDDEMDDFLKELGFGESFSSPTPSDDIDEIFNDTPTFVYTKTEEERLAETAAKRADIVGRHEKWFEKLHDSVEERGSELVNTLQRLRDNAAIEVKHMGVRPSGTAGINAETVPDAKSLVGVEKDGERLIKGLEGYLQKAESRSSDWKLPKDAPRDDEAKKTKQDIGFQEKDKFADIVSKVENKFSNRVSTVQAVIRNWYVDLKDTEAEVVLSTAQTVKDLASRAQEDLAMDYAWLDDVTYLDWQRYHDLMRIYDKFDETVRQIANGTSTNPTPPSDPVVQALNELDKELQDIILGFNFALSGIRSRGLKVFNLRPLAAASDEDKDDDGFFVIQDNERRIVDLRSADLGDVPLKEGAGRLALKPEDSVDRKDGENVQILPIPDTQQPQDQGPGFDAFKIIIGKDKVQIEEALKDIPLEPSAQNHEKP